MAMDCQIPGDIGAHLAPLGAADASIEQLIESDRSLVPAGASAFQVAPTVMDAQEIAAQFAGLELSLAQAHDSRFDPAMLEQVFTRGSDEPHATSVGCRRSDPKLSPLAWLFPDHAGVGRPARHKQSDH